MSSRLVCHLHKSLYGLKQSPGAWFGLFNEVIQKFSMTLCDDDHSMFYRHTIVGCIYLVVYVDDIVLIGNDDHDIIQIFLED